MEATELYQNSEEFVAHLFWKKVFILWYFLVCDSHPWRISMKWKIRNLIFDRMKDIWWDGYLISDAELWFVMETFELIENLYLMEDIRWWLDQLPNCFAISINKDLDCAFCTVHTVHTMLFHSGKKPTCWVTSINKSFGLCIMTIHCRAVQYSAMDCTLQDCKGKL